MYYSYIPVYTHTYTYPYLLHIGYLSDTGGASLGAVLTGAFRAMVLGHLGRTYGAPRLCHGPRIDLLAGTPRIGLRQNGHSGHTDLNTPIWDFTKRTKDHKADDFGNFIGANYAKRTFATVRFV